ncbi:hypothetical protein [Actinoplanes sp. TFC3]|uniref:hypothetical protein n=1 Tax=Actinoplanes sp. TFC3 TaxID=1710355 RepID=UPI000AC483F9|nr:hypothetical protein [Actinoplanes sp. TFC3]
MRSDDALAAATGGAGSLLIKPGGALGRSGLSFACAGLALLAPEWRGRTGVRRRPQGASALLRSH